MIEVWAQSLRGRAIDLVHPKVDQVDFREIADTLANINRYAGCSLRQVNVAHHSLIALTVAKKRQASPVLQAMVALHDAHEGNGLGDFTTPAAQALAAIADEIYGAPHRDSLRGSIKEIKHRHDIVIHEAAGLPMPTAEQKAFITECDIAALNTERRDFLSPTKRAWAPHLASVPPLPREEKWMSPGDAASELYRAFRMLLPALRDCRARGAA